MSVLCSPGRLKILQEVITLCVFVPFDWFYMKEPLRLHWKIRCREQRNARKFTALNLFARNCITRTWMTRTWITALPARSAAR